MNNIVNIIPKVPKYPEATAQIYEKKITTYFEEKHVLIIMLLRIASVNKQIKGMIIWTLLFLL